MIVLAWLLALVVAGLILGIVGFGLAGQAGRLRRAMAAAQGDVRPRTVSLLAQLPQQTSSGRHSVERQENSAG